MMMQTLSLNSPAGDPIKEEDDDRNDEDIEHGPTGDPITIYLTG